MSVMATNFDDGIAYDAWMGRWSKKVGEKFNTSAIRMHNHKS